VCEKEGKYQDVENNNFIRTNTEHAHDCITRSQFIVNAAICITGHLSMQNIEKEMLMIGGDV
jgi:acyl-[acyl carrier protein]--UDP-N-acetylglucosamine O-acyltransferase